MNTHHVYTHDIVFDMSEWIHKNHIWSVSPEYLLDLVHRYSATHKLIFVCSDGENPILSGLFGILENAAKELTLPKEQIELASFSPLESESITITQLNPLIFARPLSAYWHEIRNTEFDKKFIGLYRRHTSYRAKAAQFLHTLPGEPSIVSYTEKDLTLEAFNKVHAEYATEYQWVEETTPINQLGDIPLTRTDFIDWREISESLANSYHKYFIEFVVETDHTNAFFFTEKTLRNFFFGKPFLLFSGKGALENLRKMGARTFSPYIDESYDSISNHTQRFDAITKEIARLNLLSIDELKQLALEMHPIFEHNQRVLRNRQLNAQRCNWGQWTRNPGNWSFLAK